MLGDETELEMVQRHVREGEAHVKRQREIVAELPADSPMLEMAKVLLAQFEDLLDQHHAHLDRLLGAR